jgi:type II secretory pathway component PulF
MSLFHYKAYNSTGETITGAVEAENVRTLETRLRTTGSWLLEARTDGLVTVAGDSPISRTKVRGSDVIAFFVQMSLLLRSGITLPNALGRLAEDFDGTKMGEVIIGIADKVVIGVPLHTALETYPRVFSRQVIAMIEAGEVSGQMPEVFKSLSDYYEWLDGLVAEIRQALIYPIIVVLAATGLIILLFTMVVPKFVTLLTDLSLEVPALTSVVMSISDLLVGGWIYLVAAAVIVPVGLKIALREPGFARLFDRRLMDIPVFGSLVAMFGLSRFANNLGMLYRSGIPLLRGLEICRSLVGNRAIESALDDVRRGVLEGTPMSKCMTRHDVFPSTLITMIATGESSGRLDEALARVAQYHNALIPRRIKVVFAIFNPAVMLALIGVVGVVALAVILPILQLWGMR